LSKDCRLSLYRDGNGFYLDGAQSPISVAQKRTNGGSTKYKLTQTNDDGTRSYESWSSLVSQSSSEYERLIVRKNKKSKSLTVIRSNPTKTAKEIKDKSNLLSTGAIKYTIESNGIVTNNNTLLLGCKNGGSKDTTRCCCSIHNFKMWNLALSDDELEKMSIAPKETLTF
jgi:hypothetical protein